MFANQDEKVEDGDRMHVRQVDLVRMDIPQQRSVRRHVSTVGKPRAERDDLQQAFVHAQAERKLGKLLIKKLKGENSTLSEKYDDLQNQFAQQLDEARNREQELIDRLESSQRQLIALKRENDGLREVLLEMEGQQIDISNEELIALRKALAVAEEKRSKAEEQAQHSDLLRRERQVQEIAIEMLSDDLDELNGEKAKLIEECDRLNRELSESRGQFFENLSEP
jgi:predicted nuclease with TOPRIM domain